MAEKKGVALLVGAGDAIGAAVRERWLNRLYRATGCGEVASARR